MAKKVVVRDQEFIIAFGKKVKEIRLEKKISQYELYYSTGISTSQIRRIEKGQVNPSISVISYLAQAFEIDPKDLLDF